MSKRGNRFGLSTVHFKILKKQVAVKSKLEVYITILSFARLLLGANSREEELENSGIKFTD